MYWEKEIPPLCRPLEGNFAFSLRDGVLVCYEYCSYYASIAQTVADKKLSRVLVTDEAWLMPGAELMFPQHAD